MKAAVIIIILIVLLGLVLPGSPIQIIGKKGGGASIFTMFSKESKIYGQAESAILSYLRTVDIGNEIAGVADEYQTDVRSVLVNKCTKLDDEGNAYSVDATVSGVYFPRNSDSESADTKKFDKDKTFTMSKDRNGKWQVELK